MRDIQLIQIYYTVCQHYNTTLAHEVQRLSNNFCPKFTDEECLATYIFGIANQKLNTRACYDFIKDYYDDWFPNLPSYQAYNARVCYLAQAFRALASILLMQFGFDESHADFVMDSLPIVVAGSARSGRAKVAPELCDKGYCAAKKMYYYGIKLHILAQCNHKAMPTPVSMMTSRASTHDLDIGKEILSDARNIRVFCDMAFIDKEWQARMLNERDVEIITPVKRKTGQKVLDSADKLFSRAVSSIKQAIESLNNWLIEKTNIQKASKVRSEAGLTAFIFARVACACLVF